MTMNPRNTRSTQGVSRRAALAAGAFGVVAAGANPVAAADAASPSSPPHQASGVKVGEVTDHSAIVWVRLTATPERNKNGVNMTGRFKKGQRPQAPEDVSTLEGACPGTAGQVRVRYGTMPDLTGANATDWQDVTAEADFQHQFALNQLTPATEYFFAAETAGQGGSPRHQPLTGKFRTAPMADASVEVKFCVVTCLMYADLDHRDGFNIYPAITKLDPSFVAFTGDNVYYDSEEPRAVSAELARYHWQRMYSLPRAVDMIRNVATYWEKDDHDTVDNDSWPGRRMGRLTFPEGQQIFRQQVPLGESIYRTVRWGQHLQIWLTDGRDFRTPNSDPDGPEKTIWGAKQKAWLKQTLAQSNVTWKVLISPTPIVGPDRTNKNDNHANKGFAHEGNEIRSWLQQNVPNNFFVICGDRHWQYHSVHPDTKVHEFAVGPGSDEHASGTPGQNDNYHRFHRVKGGFLSVAAAAKEIVFQHHDVHGGVVYEYRHT